MATAEQLKEIRRKAGIGEFKKTAGNGPTSSPRRKRRSSQPETNYKSSRFNYATSTNTLD